MHHVIPIISKLISFLFFLFFFKFATRKTAISNKEKYSVEQLLTEKLSLQNVQIVCILFILLNGKCIFIRLRKKIFTGFIAGKTKMPDVFESLTHSRWLFQCTPSRLVQLRSSIRFFLGFKNNTSNFATCLFLVLSGTEQVAHEPYSGSLHRGGLNY